MPEYSAAACVPKNLLSIFLIRIATATSDWLSPRINGRNNGNSPALGFI
jgi:hypothetical protein